MTRGRACAKLNLALVVGPVRDDGLHELVTVLQTIDLADDVALEPADRLVVEGFAGDTLVRAALEALAARVGVEPAWRAHITKRIPVAAGLGGGSSDAATALRLANDLLAEPLPQRSLHEIGAGLGADVPFFLQGGTQLGTGNGTTLAPLQVPAAYVALLVLPHDARKASTRDVYLRFDERHGEDGYDDRRSELLRAVDGVGSAIDLARLPLNDLASSGLATELLRLGAFRADVTGAGPVVYALFDDEPDARRAADALASAGKTWIARPVAGSSPTGR